MSKYSLEVLFVWIISISLMFSCISETEKKERVVRNISNELCNNLSENLSKEFAEKDSYNESFNALVITLLAPFNITVKDFCVCFTKIISQELLNRFSYEELIEIEKDNIKQLMIVAKLIENNTVQTTLENCLNETIDKANNKYNDFNNKLNDKFNK